MQTIELLDKSTNTKQTYVLREDLHQEQLKENNIYILVQTVLKATIKALKFSLYLIVNFLELFLKVIKVLFNLTEYKPFKSITEGKESILDRIAFRNINKEKIRFSTDFLCRHEYSFPRSDNFLNTYKTIQQRLKDISDNNIKLNNDLYKDTIYQINVLVVEAEKQALSEGYSYARETKYKLDTSTVYEDFIQEKIMTGESNRKFKVED